MDEEIEYICQGICELVCSGVDLNSIKLCCVDNTYEGCIKRIFDMYNIPINLYKTSIYFENYERDYLKEKLNKEFKKIYDKELKYKMTLIGPHRDDIEFYIKDKNIKQFASQGQQRMAVLALKLAEINIFKQYKNNYPIILLDDVFSELDKKKKNNLLKYINDDIQVIITTTDLSNISKKLLNKAKLIQIENGQIKKNSRGERK